MNLLTERRSIRKYDPNIKISQEEMSEIISKASRAPSSMNMQPWRFFVIESKEAKERLRPALMGNTLQLETSSAMILIMNDLNKFDLAETIYNMAVDQGLMPIEVRDKQLNNIANLVPKFPRSALERDGLLDCGIVAMQLMNVAREHGYDTCPIGGFYKDRINEIMGIDSKRYVPAVIISIGKADEAGYPSLRLDVKDTTTFL
ncbi:MAG: nitroreductase family protein [Acholeplasmataceae bacterium]